MNPPPHLTHEAAAADPNSAVASSAAAFPTLVDPMHAIQSALKDMSSETDKLRHKVTNLETELAFYKQFYEDTKKNLVKTESKIRSLPSQTPTFVDSNFTFGNRRGFDQSAQSFSKSVSSSNPVEKSSIFSPGTHLLSSAPSLGGKSTPINNIQSATTPNASQIPVPLPQHLETSFDVNFLEPANVTESTTSTPGKTRKVFTQKRPRASTVDGNAEGKIASFDDSPDMVAKAERIRGPGGTFIKKQSLMSTSPSSSNNTSGDVTDNHANNPRGQRDDNNDKRDVGGIHDASSRAKRGSQYAPVANVGGSASNVYRQHEGAHESASPENVAKPIQSSHVGQGHRQEVTPGYENQLGSIDELWQAKVIEQAASGGWSIGPKNDTRGAQPRSSKRARITSSKLRDL